MILKLKNASWSGASQRDLSLMFGMALDAGQRDQAVAAIIELMGTAPELVRNALLSGDGVPEAWYQGDARAYLSICRQTVLSTAEKARLIAAFTANPHCPGELISLYQGLNLEFPSPEWLQGRVDEFYLINPYFCAILAQELGVAVSPAIIEKKAAERPEKIFTSHLVKFYGMGEWSFRTCPLCAGVPSIENIDYTPHPVRSVNKLNITADVVCTRCNNKIGRVRTCQAESFLVQEGTVQDINGTELSVKFGDPLVPASFLLYLRAEGKGDYARELSTLGIVIKG